MAKRSTGIIVQDSEAVAKWPASFPEIRGCVIPAYYLSGISAGGQK